MAKEKDVPRRYEGPRILGELLAAAGSELSVEEVRAEFFAALEEDPETRPGEILPLLFEGEPHFPGPDAARRTYANLLGLWDAVRAEHLGGPLRVLGDGPAPAPEPPPEGAAAGREVPLAYVEWAWRALVEGDARDRRRAEDRFENRQGALADWIRDRLADVAPEAEEIALGLAVATHEAFLRAFGAGRVGAVAWQSLSRPAGSNGTAELQPHLALHHDEILEAAVAEADDGLDEAGRAAVSGVLAAVRRALTEALS
jgi:hypothetical protein